jgi:hypothetical protein
VADYKSCFVTRTNRVSTGYRYILGLLHRVLTTYLNTYRHKSKYNNDVNKMAYVRAYFGGNEVAVRHRYLSAGTFLSLFPPHTPMPSKLLPTRHWPKGKRSRKRLEPSSVVLSKGRNGFVSWFGIISWSPQ